MGYKKLITRFKGDTFLEWKMDYLDKDSNPINLTGVEIISQFRKDCKTGTVARDMSVGSGITIVDAANGIYKIDEFVLDWDANIYYYDIQFTFTNGIEKTPIFGDITVVQDVTQKV